MNRIKKILAAFVAGTGIKKASHWSGKKLAQGWKFTAKQIKTSSKIGFIPIKWSAKKTWVAGKTVGQFVRTRFRSVVRKPLVDSELWWLMKKTAGAILITFWFIWQNTGGLKFFLPSIFFLAVVVGAAYIFQPSQLEIPLGNILWWAFKILFLTLGVISLIFAALLKIHSKRIRAEAQAGAQKAARVVFYLGTISLIAGSGMIAWPFFRSSIREPFQRAWEKFRETFLEFWGNWQQPIIWAAVGLAVLLVGTIVWRWISGRFYEVPRRFKLAFGIVVGLGLLHLFVWSFFPDFWESWLGYPVLFWVANAGVAVVIFLATSGIPGGKWLAVPLAVIVLGGIYYHFKLTPAGEKISKMVPGADASGPVNGKPSYGEPNWSKPAAKNGKPDYGKPNWSKPEPKRRTGTTSWVMPKGVEGKYKNERSSVNRVEIIRNDEEVFHYIVFCRHTGRKLTDCFWNRKASKRGTLRAVDTLHNNEVRTGNWYLIQDPENPLLYRGAWSGPLDSGGHDVPYELVIDP